MNKHIISMKSRLSAGIITIGCIIALMLGTTYAAYQGYPVFIISSGSSTMVLTGNVNIGKILKGENQTTATVTPTTTVRQDMTGKVLTGVDDISLLNAYKRAHEYGLTSLGFPYARLNSPVLRYEFAIMMMNYIENVENKSISHNEICVISHYNDYKKMSSTMRSYVQKACDAGLLGWRSEVNTNNNITWLLPAFRPFDTLSQQELNIVLQRYIPTTIRLFPTSNTRGDLLRFLYSVSPKQ